jgi:hypothetical protein
MGYIYRSQRQEVREPHVFESLFYCGIHNEYGRKITTQTTHTNSLTTFTVVSKVGYGLYGEGDKH